MMKDLKNVSVQVLDSDLALLLPNGVYEIKQMDSKSSRFRKLGYLCLFLALSGIVGLGYFCPDKVCALSYKEASVISVGEDNLGKPLTFSSSKIGLSYDDMLNDDFSFDMDSHDVMVFLHMQKTGGTSFGKHLVHDLDLQRPCTCPLSRKRCYCFRPHSNQSWLFSRYTTGWKCGLHADWTELTSCVDSKLDELEGAVIKRRYFYITLLREPVSRYLSEFRHVQRGATWKGSRHWCGGRQAHLENCYRGEDWEGVTLDEFISCENNLAINRQTRMLADLQLVGCYDSSTMSKADRERTMLISAKRNLESMAFFGLTEYQKMSQYIFEETFNLRFAVPFEQNNATVSSSTMPTLTTQQAAKIAALNNLDVELYKYAKELMLRRFQKLKSRDKDFEERWTHLGEVVGTGGKGGVTEFDWDRLVEESDKT